MTVVAGLINARSAVKHHSDINDLVSTNSLDILFITETWLRHDDPPSTMAMKFMCPPEYEANAVHRPSNKRGGGVAIIHRSTTTVKKLDIVAKASSFEFLCVRCSSPGSASVIAVLVYRPPPLSKTTFNLELDGILAECSYLGDRLLLCGDVNLHLEKGDSDPTVCLFKQTLAAHGLQVDSNFIVPTHNAGHTLDVVASSFALVDPTVQNVEISDHFFLRFDIPKSPLSRDVRVPSAPDSSKRSYVFRDFRAINVASFRDDMHSALGAHSTPLSVEALDRLIIGTLDKHAPASIRTSRFGSKSRPSYCPVVAAARTEQRKLERLVCRLDLEVHKQLLRSKRHEIRKLVAAFRASKLAERIEGARSSTQALFGVVNELCSPSTGVVLPSHTSSQDLANDFACYFENKITDIVSSFPPLAHDDIDFSLSSEVPKLDAFMLLNDEAVSKLRTPKCSSLDPLPVSLLSSLYPTVVPAYREVLNLSLSTGNFPDSLKKACITPLIKKPSLCKDSLSSYRPVSNLSFLSKLFETAVANQLVSHFECHGLLHPHQSAYRKLHSVETALLHVTSSALCHLDSGRVVFLVLLDLSAAFDTIDHNALLNVMQSEFGISGTALAWLSSYLSDRSYTVKIDSATSDPRPLGQGVPQGSVLGPILFNCFMTDLLTNLAKLDVEFHTYADDTQLWVSFDPKSPDGEREARERLTRALDFTVGWMRRRRLKLNCDKTIFLPLHRSVRCFSPIICDSVSIVPSTTAKNLGVLFDCRLDLTDHITAVRKSCFYHLRRLQSCKHLIGTDHLELLVHAFVTSRLDFCNGLLFGITQKNMLRLQSVQSAAAKFITGARKFDSVSEQLLKLHWLPVHKRIIFKLCIIGFHIKNHTISYPSYLSLVEQGVRRSARLASSSELRPDFTPKLKSCGSRSFGISIPKCFNLLPSSIRSVTSFTLFKRQVKTSLFSLIV